MIEGAAIKFSQHTHLPLATLLINCENGFDCCYTMRYALCRMLILKKE